MKSVTLRLFLGENFAGFFILSRDKYYIIINSHYFA